MFKQLQRKIKLLVSRAVVNIVTDSLKQQNMQINLLDGETADDVERFQNYGHTSVPPAGSEAIVLSVGGKRQHLVAVVVDSKSSRLKDLKSGDSALYHLDGHYLLLTEEQLVNLVCKNLHAKADEKILFETQQTQFTGNVDIIGGDSKASGTSTAADHISGDISFLNHVHYCEKCGSTTSKPQAG
ncbi:phage baseplate protein [Gilliamella sp. HK2]|jgi:phage baseplate assembly protein V|uniref:phage baseplate assembly protein V n=1 Tax=unclassified Gilliamella TaxID=2685620 RepID=UPI00080EC9D5|nr:phage baseplate assembly protein V [Gilliamella apicola]OCG27181.1 phage baseplate protein [Gilliamella apicola]OCG29265.1 phage baseplate protein [Gilliamella apicola]